MPDALPQPEKRRAFTAREGRGAGFGFASCANSHCDRTAIIRLPGTETAVCNKHYQRAINGKDWTAPDKATQPNGKCAAPGCERTVRSKYASRCETHYYRKRRSSKLDDGPIQLPCDHCGEPLSRNQSKFCSARCQWTNYRKDLKVRLSNLDGSHRRRAIAHDAPHEKKVDLFAVIERDGWCCYICKEAIDADLRFPHPMSLSIDHEHALAAGGGHTFANCRATHKQCNFQKAYDQDIKQAAKSRRLRGLTGQRARRERRGGSSIKSASKIPSRGFQKRTTPHKWPKQGFGK